MVRSTPQLHTTYDKNCPAVLLGIWACAIDVFGKTINDVHQAGIITSLLTLWMVRILQFSLLLCANYSSWTLVQNSSNTASDSFSMIILRSVSSSVTALACGSMLFKENIIYSVLGAIMMLEGISLLISCKKEKSN